jgi:uncharacterized membrane protein HdeD (DUF308 family)
MVYEITQSMVVVLFVLTSAVLYKYSGMKDKGTKGWIWLTVGALILLLDTSIRLINWPIVGLQGAVGWISLPINTIAAAVMIIGTIKLLLEQFE